jgi:hypothetical protein
MLVFSSDAVSAAYMLVSHSSRALVHVRRVTTDTYNSLLFKKAYKTTAYLYKNTINSIPTYLLKFKCINELSLLVGKAVV